MPFFAYQAKDRQGNPVNGELEAQDDNAVADTLLRRGLIPLSIKQSNGNKEGEKSAITTFFQPKVSLDELIIFSRQMYSDSSGRKSGRRGRGLRPSDLSARPRRDSLAVSRGRPKSNGKNL